MANQIASLLNSYRQGMQPVGQNALGHTLMMQDRRKADEAAQAQGAQTQFENKLKTAKEGREQSKEARDQDIYLRAKRLEKMDEWMGPASVATTPEKWADAQEGGFLPKEVKFENREAFIMAAMDEAERLARDVEARKAEMDERKQGETERHNRATEKNARITASKSGSGPGAGRPKIADEKAIRAMVGEQFGARYNPITGAYAGVDDPEAKKQVQKISTDAVRLYQHNPTMTGNMAVEEALRRNGIEVQGSTNTGAGQPTMGAGQPANNDPLGWRQ